MKNYLPERIKERRIRLGLRQEDLAQKANLTQAQVSKYERGENEPSIEMIFFLAQILETSADYLIGLTHVERTLEGEPYLTEAEKQLVEIFRSKSPEAQQRLLDVAKVV